MQLGHFHALCFKFVPSYMCLFWLWYKSLMQKSLFLYGSHSSLFVNTIFSKHMNMRTHLCQCLYYLYYIIAYIANVCIAYIMRAIVPQVCAPLHIFPPRPKHGVGVPAPSHLPPCPPACPFPDRSWRDKTRRTAIACVDRVAAKCQYFDTCL